MARTLPRPFEFPWGKGFVTAKVSVVTQHREPTIQLLEKADDAARRRAQPLTERDIVAPEMATEPRAAGAPPTPSPERCAASEGGVERPSHTSGRGVSPDRPDQKRHSPGAR